MLFQRSSHYIPLVNKHDHLSICFKNICTTSCFIFLRNSHCSTARVLTMIQMTYNLPTLLLTFLLSYTNLNFNANFQHILSLIVFHYSSWILNHSWDVLFSCIIKDYTPTFLQFHFSHLNL